jgi:prepilin-type N-terminal cleavage/methylation domain-containing protein
MRIIFMKKGFTLVELVIVITIIAIMAVMLIGNLNPVMLVGRANDAKRKKDMGRIRVAFEEYFSDRGCYPSQTNLDATINVVSNCNGGAFPWLGTWPCDPDGRVPYPIYVEPGDCPHWFTIYTNLQNKTDSDIPPNWYNQSMAYSVGSGNLSIQQTNYGISSPNIIWYEMTMAEECLPGFDGGIKGINFEECYSLAYDLDGNELWSALTNDYSHPNSYTAHFPRCKVDCCFKGRVCP